MHFSSGAVVRRMRDAAGAPRAMTRVHGATFGARRDAARARVDTAGTRVETVRAHVDVVRTHVDVIRTRVDVTRTPGAEVVAGREFPRRRGDGTRAGAVMTGRRRDLE